MNKYIIFAGIAIAGITIGFLRINSTGIDNTGIDMGANKAELKSGIRLQNQDSNIRPQDDFYRFSNGRWLQKTEIPADKSNYGSFSILADKARDDVKKIIEEAASSSDSKSQAAKLGKLYNSFMNTELLEVKGLKPLQTIIDSIDAIDSPEALAQYFASASRIASSTPFGFYIDTDSKQPDRYLPYFYQAGLGLPDRDYYFRDDEKSQQIRTAYVQHIQTMFELADWEQAQAAATIIMALEMKIAKGHWTRVERRDRDKTYNPYTQETLALLAPDFAWKPFFEAVGLATQTEIIVRNPSYFTHFAQLIASEPLQHWKTYARWHALTSYASILNKTLDDENFHFYGTVLNGTQEQEARWKRAVNVVNSVLGELVGLRYVTKHFPSDAKQRMQVMVENLREAYRISILNLDWMSDITKQQAIEKLNKFRPKIGYPDKWKDYSALTITADDLFGNKIRANQFQYQFEINKLGQPVDRDEWFMTPQTVNAYYNPGMNEIVFPAAILQPPFFDLEADDAVNYGGIGAVIGHEMGHGFDDQGAKSDGDGVLRNWWTEQDLNEFKKRTSKLVEQYSAFTVLDGEHINGELTLGENIGDLGGLSIAYRAYHLSLANNSNNNANNDTTAPILDNYTGNQRFFLGWAQVWARKYRDEALLQRLITDPHSPSEFRANGILRNMPAFYEAFDVKEGDKLYLPEQERVKIW